MQNNKAKLLLVFFLLIISLPLASATYTPRPFMNYGVNAFWNETADCAGALCQTWTGTSGSVVRATDIVFNGTGSVDLTLEVSVGNYSVGSLPTNVNITFHVYTTLATVSADIGSWGISPKTIGSCQAGGQGICIGALNSQSATKWIYWNGASWSVTAKDYANGWHKHEIRLYGTNFELYIDGDSIANGTSAQIGPNVHIYASAGDDIRVDDLYIWNSTVTAPVEQILTLDIDNKVNGTTLRGLCVDLDNGTTTTLCNNTGTQVTHNVTGVYNLSWYNISGNTYYNQSLTNYNFSATTTVTANTSQSRLFVRTTKLFLNTFIQNYTITNDQVANNTNSYGLFIPANNASNNLMASVTGNYTLNQSCTSPLLGTGNCTISGVYDNQYTFLATDLFNGGAVSNFTINASNNTLGSTSGSTTTRNVTLNLLQGYEYLVQFQGDNHEWINKTLPANASTHSYTFNVYTRNSVNISFYDELTTNLINHVQASVEYIGSVESGNKSTTTGHVYLDLLTPDTYTLRYSATGYTERFYVLTILNNTFQRLNLTLLNSSSGGTNVTITVKDTLDNLVEGAVVKILKYDLTNNDYDIVDIVTTNFEGESVADIILNSEYYKFIVEYNGVVVLTTNPSYIYGTSLTLIVDLVQGAGFQVATDYSHLSGTITYLNASNQFKYVYNDATNTASQGCLYLYTLGSTKTLYNTSCSSSSSGTIYMSANNATSNYWQAEGYITDSGGVQHLIDSYVLSFKTNLPETGEGMFMLILLVILSALIGVWRIDVSVLLASLQPLLFTIMGFVQLGYVYTVPIFVLGIFMAYLLRLNS